jgi:hypothetical protein
MGLPGFMAETSLYRSYNSYRRSWWAGPPSNRGVITPSDLPEDLRNFFEGGGGFTGSGGFGGGGFGGGGGGGGAPGVVNPACVALGIACALALADGVPFDEVPICALFLEACTRRE